MPHILLIEDDASQRLLRRLILESHGHTVTTAASAGEALGLDCLSPRAGAAAPDCVLMDLRLPAFDDGLRLVRFLHSSFPRVPVVVLSGAAAEFEASPERPMVQSVFRKPVRMQALLGALARLLALLLCPLLLAAPPGAGAREFSFSAGRTGETIGALELASPASDWAEAGRAAAVAVLTLDGKTKQHLFVFAGNTARQYRFFLGPLAPGPHTLRVERDAALSAPGSDLVIGGARFETLEDGDPRALMVRHAPVLLARPGTPGRFTDAPLAVYCTRGSDAGLAWLEYTVIFSNEDGGTSTRDLMARWGRTTDIEYVYRVWTGPGGQAVKTLIQTREHQDVPYEGPRFGAHPILQPVTDNNMVEPAGPDAAPLRHQFVPILADLSAGSRERVMDAEPFTYAIAAKELAREGKIRRAGQWFDGENVADPRRYLVAEFLLRNRAAAVQMLVRRRGSPLWTGSSLGLAKNFIERSGWVRTAVELPEATAPSGIEEIAFQCLSRRDLERQPVGKDGSCAILALGKFFLPGRDYWPGPPLGLPQPPAGGWQLKVGEMVSFRLD